jgi:hypothetical protein
MTMSAPPVPSLSIDDVDALLSDSSSYESISSVLGDLD